MILEHRGRSPRITPSTHVSPATRVVGNVTIGPGAAVLAGAVLTAEGGDLPRERFMSEMTGRYARALARHGEDRVLSADTRADRSPWRMLAARLWIWRGW